MPKKRRKESLPHRKYYLVGQSPSRNNRYAPYSCAVSGPRDDYFEFHSRKLLAKSVNCGTFFGLLMHYNKDPVKLSIIPVYPFGYGLSFILI